MARFFPILVLALAALTAPLGGCGIPTDKDRNDLARAFSMYSSRQFATAEGVASDYIRRFPNDENVDEAYYLRGLSRQGAGDRTGAAADLHAAIAKTKRQDLKAKAHRGLGDIAYDNQRWDEAIGLYQVSLKESDGKFDAAMYERLGAAYQALGRWDDALPYFQRIIESKPDAPMMQRAIIRKNARRFELQFAAYTDANNARNQVAALKTQGITANLNSELREGKLFWLVRTGSFSNYAEAETARRRYVAKFPAVVVVP